MKTIILSLFVSLFFLPNLHAQKETITIGKEYNNRVYGLAMQLLHGKLYMDRTDTVQRNYSIDPPKEILAKVAGLYEALGKGTMGMEGEAMLWDAMSLKHLIVTTEKGISQTALQNDTTFQQLVASCGLRITRASANWDSTSTVYLETDRRVDVLALGKILRQRGLISYASVDHLVIMNGTRLKIAEKDGQLIYTEAYGRGDCPAGCIDWTTTIYTYDIETGKIVNQVTKGDGGKKRPKLDDLDRPKAN